MVHGHDVHKIASGGLAPWQVKLALRLLLGNLGDNLPVARLAGVCGLSPSYFIRAFRVSMGLPPHRWLLHYRIKRAQELLEQTNESIAAISADCGFADQSHLTRVFHDLVGASPAAWRRQRRAVFFQRLH
jgi:transcriptional regulator GlxA family with amidase domain